MYTLPIVQVTSGLQSGVDQVGLEVAWLAAYPTGGVAPKGYRTDEGPRVELGRFYRLTESFSAQYAPRTIANARRADLTVWFGDPTSPGGVLTLRHAGYAVTNPRMAEMISAIICASQIVARAIVLNVAGNRLRTNPAATDYARSVLTEALRAR